MKFKDLDSVAKEYNIGGGNAGFLKLETGDNKVRVVSDYEVLAKHWNAAGKSVVCIGKEKGCPFCNEEPKIDSKTGKKIYNKPNVKFLMHVIDRKDGQLKIAELGWTIVNAIRELSQDEEYGFEELPPYDINIKKTVKGQGKNPSDTEYTVIAARTNTELTAEEKEKVEALTPIGDIVQKIKDKASGADTAEKAEEDGVEEVNPDDIPYGN